MWAGKGAVGFDMFTHVTGCCDNGPHSTLSLLSLHSPPNFCWDKAHREGEHSMVGGQLDLCWLRWPSHPLQCPPDKTDNLWVTTMTFIVLWSDSIAGFMLVDNSSFIGHCNLTELEVSYCSLKIFHTMHKCCSPCQTAALNTHTCIHKTPIDVLLEGHCVTYSGYGRQTNWLNHNKWWALPSPIPRPAHAPLSWHVKGHMWGQESRVGDGLGMRLVQEGYIHQKKTANSCDINFIIQCTSRYHPCPQNWLVSSSYWCHKPQ